MSRDGEPIPFSESRVSKVRGHLKWFSGLTGESTHLKSVIIIGGIVIGPLIAFGLTGDSDYSVRVGTALGLVAGAVATCAVDRMLRQASLD